MGYTNSPLIDYTKLSPNHSGQRKHKIDTITIHCYVGQVTAKQGCDYFATTNRDASANYVVGTDGSIGLSVEEKNRAHTSSNASNDDRAITIEVASDTKHPYAVTDAAYNSLIKLCADICKRNGIEKLLWKADKSLIGQIDKQNMTVHRWFKSKACPGDYLYNRHGEIANKVNEILSKKCGWVQDENGWKYRNEDGTYSKNQWVQLDSWFYFNENGYAECNGWKKIKGKWYYFDKDCRMKTGWLEEEKKWYYLNSDGEMVTGLQTISGQTYYFASDGHMCRTNDNGALV